MILNVTFLSFFLSSCFLLIIIFVFIHSLACLFFFFVNCRYYYLSLSLC